MALLNSSQGAVAQSAWKNRAKRLGDLLIAVLLIALTLPLMAFVALAIKCESCGPVFIREEGVAARGRRFAALKFRSTAHGGELDDRADQEKGGARPTRIGWFLRYTRIDNLPMLFNVLRGEMSSVGAPFLD